jgi:hypothetical protein
LPLVHLCVDMLGYEGRQTLWSTSMHEVASFHVLLGTGDASSEHSLHDIRVPLIFQKA